MSKDCFILVAAALLMLVVLAWSLMGAHTAPGPVATTSKSKLEKENDLSPAPVPFWRHRTFWRFALWAFLVYGVQFSFQGLWGAAYLQNTYGISRETAGSHLLFASLGILAGGLFWGFLSDRYFRARRPVLFLGTLGMLIAWAIMSTLASYPGPFLTSLLYLALGLFSIVFLINFSCVKEIFPVAKAGTAIGAINTFMLLSVAVYQGVTGYIIDHFLKNGSALTAYRAVFFLYLGSIVAAFLLVFFMPETFPNREK